MVRRERLRSAHRAPQYRPLRQAEPRFPLSSRRTLLTAFVLGVVALVWFLWPDHPAVSTAEAEISNPKSQIPALPPPIPPPPRSTLADTLNAPGGDIRADLRIVLDVIDAFRSNFPRDGNPVGTNADITAALTGRNRLRLALIPPDHPAISAAGELCDRWGTPYFFHAASATRMEIRSAGPDSKMWTNDDELLAP